VSAHSSETVSDEIVYFKFSVQQDLKPERETLDPLLFHTQMHTQVHTTKGLGHDTGINSS